MLSQPACLRLPTQGEERLKRLAEAIAAMDFLSIEELAGIPGQVASAACLSMACSATRRLAGEPALAAVNGQDREFLECVARGFTSAQASNIPLECNVEHHVLSHAAGQQEEKIGSTSVVGKSTPKQAGMV